MKNLAHLLLATPIIPVVTVDHPEDAVPIAKALKAGGIPVIEVTLRNKYGMEVLSLIKLHVPDMMVGVGTVTHPDHMIQGHKRGADFFVSPGFTHELGRMAQYMRISYLPGAITPCEVMTVIEYNFSFIKLFPAELFGSLELLKNYASLFSEIRFCPSGGINEENVQSYLNLPNVTCVGGSFLTPKALVQQKKWDQLTDHIRKTVESLTVK